MDYQRFYEINRACLALIRELAIMEGVKVAATLTGMPEREVRRLVEMGSDELDEIASLGILLIRIRLPEAEARSLIVSRLLEEKLCAA